jgi:exopolyphosphatase / guanosine-5'-triphosphate,3'-diphosphate pyrophosphatase
VDQERMNEQYAVLDLGSNSFRLLLARRQGELLQVVERVKEKVQLVRGLRDGQLDAAAMARGRQCLLRYAQRLAGVPRDRIAMVGTHALRVGSNRDQLVEDAEATIGVPLAILAGEEEAALIYRGVQAREPTTRSVRRLVIDVGGGSTEFAWGTAGAPAGVRSVQVGCVSLGDRFFRPGVPLPVAFDAARAYLQEHLPALDPIDQATDVVGTSGTIESVQAVLAANGWSDRAITADGLAHAVDALFNGRWDAEAGLLGLAPDRIDIFPAGLALLDMLFRRLGITSMRYVGAALEDGVLDGMLYGEARADDARQAALRGLQARYGIDGAQARRVRNTALALFDQASGWWSTSAGPCEPDWRALLGGAAELHELGLVVSPRAYHRHGAYLLRHAELQGFSATEREYLALLVRGHRRGLPVLTFSGLGPRDRRTLLRLVALLRIAVILERSHAEGASPVVRLDADLDGEVDGDRLRLALPRGWLDTHPLSRRELEVEPAQLAAAGIRFELATF